DVIEARQQVDDGALPAAGGAQQRDRLARLHLERHAVQDRVAAFEVAERDVVELDATLYVLELERVRLVGDVGLGIQDLEDALHRRRRLRHQVNNEAELAHRQEQVREVQAELLPFADGQRPGDDLSAAEIQDRRLAQIGDQEDHREQE